MPDSPDDVIQGWHMIHVDSDHDSAKNTDGTPRSTIVFFHENAGNLGLRLDYFNMLYHDMGHNILAFAYRGYSDSKLKSGFPNEVILKQDARLIVQYLKEHKNPNQPLFLVGRSLGGAVAAYAAA